MVFPFQNTASAHLLSPLHFIEATMEQPRNNTIKIHILQLETQLQVKLIQKTNLY